MRPKALTPLVFSRYGGGQAYGSHVDNPLMGGIRTDVSFTLFLAEPEAYDGGALVIESPSGEDAVKLPAGHMVVYPSTALHRVEPVTRGERVAAVGWAQSHIRDAAQRELLFDLETARRRLFDRLGKTDGPRPPRQERRKPRADVGRDVTEPPGPGSSKRCTAVPSAAACQRKRGMRARRSPSARHAPPRSGAELISQRSAATRVAE